MPSTDINSLPSIILREIFLTYIRTVKLRDVQKSRSELCLVCRHWEQIAVSHARLWSIIYIFLKPVTSCPRPSTVSLFLKRSMSTPLEIYFLGADLLWEPFIDDAAYLYATTVFSLLALQVFRWQYLTIELDNLLMDKIQACITCMPFAKAKRLECVDVAVLIDVESVMNSDANDETDSNENVVLSALADAPNLRLLKWESNLDNTMRHMATTFPLEQLTHYGITCSMTLPELLQVMRKCTSVVEMRIEPVRCDAAGIYDRGSPPPSVTLPNLRVLTLDYDLFEYSIFKYFDFPNLEILNIAINYASRELRLQRDNGSDITPLLHYLSKSKHRVQVLIIHDHELRLEDLANFLSDAAVCQIPIVQVCISPLPDDIQNSALEAVKTRLPHTRRAEFRMVSREEAGQAECSTMGWTGASTYEKFKNYLLPDDGAFHCLIHRRISYYWPAGY